MKITRENYEAWFLDYHEGTLSAEGRQEVMDFLVENPDLKEEFDAFEMITLEEEDNMHGAVFINKDQLKKPVDSQLAESMGKNSLEAQMIAWYEGDLNEQEKASLLKTLSADPKARKDFDLYGKVYLKPDTSVVFANKSSLKRYTLGAAIPQWRRLAIAAAMLAFMVGMFFMLPNLTISPEIAESPAYETPLSYPDPASQPTHDNEPAAQKDQEQQQTLVVDPDEAPSAHTPLPQRPEPQDREVLRSMPSTPIQLASLEPSATIRLSASRTAESIEKRTEFFWFTFIGGEDFLADDDADDDKNDTRIEDMQAPARFSLASIAYEGIERSTGLDVRAIENQLSNRRFGLWDLAGYGLAGISQLTGTSLTVEREMDETGRLRRLGLGDRFRISR